MWIRYSIFYYLQKKLHEKDSLEGVEVDNRYRVFMDLLNRLDIRNPMLKPGIKIPNAHVLIDSFNKKNTYISPKHKELMLQFLHLILGKAYSFDCSNKDWPEEEFVGDLQSLLGSRRATFTIEEFKCVLEKAARVLPLHLEEFILLMMDDLTHRSRCTDEFLLMAKKELTNYFPENERYKSLSINR